MDLSCGDDRIIIRAEETGRVKAIEKAYMKQFDGATVKFVSNEESSKLVIDLSQQRLE